MKEYINASYIEDYPFYKNQRNFFFDFLLNPALYEKNSLSNLDSFLDITFEIIKDNNILDEEILSKNFFQKIFNFTFLFDKEDEEQKKQNSDPSLQKTEAKYFIILMRYVESFFQRLAKNQI